MKLYEVINGLDSLIDERKSLTDQENLDSVFKRDIEVLEAAKTLLVIN